MGVPKRELGEGIAVTPHKRTVDTVVGELQLYADEAIVVQSVL